MRIMRVLGFGSLVLLSAACGACSKTMSAGTQGAASLGDPAPPVATATAAAPAAAPVAAVPADEAKLDAPASPSPAATMAPHARSAKPSGHGDGVGLGALGSGAAGGAARRPAPKAERGGDFGDGFAMPAQQFAGVKAGEWDDNANYREFKSFLSSSAVNFHRVNLEDRRFLVVRDKDGHGIPRCKVTVSDGQAKTSYVTTASGRAILFPHAEGFQGGKLTATAECAEGSTQASFSAIDQQDGLVDLKLQNARKDIGARVVDVAFVLDTTGSMSEEIAAVKQTIQKVASSLSTEQVTVRIALVEYKDRTDQFTTRVFPFSSDLPSFSRKVAGISAGGGGDTPEDMNAGLHTALTQLEWSQNSVARLAFVIADAPPHLDYDGPDYAKDMKTASHRGIQLFTVAASGMDTLGQVVFRQMSQFTGGTNMFVLRGGAGPQSTGGGDPGSSCGGTHTNYSSGKLDELIVQKIRRELRSVDADPMRIAGLKQDENAKPCDQRIVWRD
jgi:Mg-chelatase subunit ChlD